MIMWNARKEQYIYVLFKFLKLMDLLKSWNETEPSGGQVRIEVQACGICHGDSATKQGLFPGIKYPRVPRHEVAGVVDEVDKDVSEWEPRQRVAVGWYGGHCGHCESCRRGDFVTCKHAQVPGISYDGGYADYMIAPTAALALIPKQLSAIEAAPLMSAGITTYNALRNSGARVGDVVAIFGIDGLGHLGIQFAAKMGFKTIAIARGKDKEEMARELGVIHYIDSQSQKVIEELAKFGSSSENGGAAEEEGTAGAKVILATVPSGKAMSLTASRGFSFDDFSISLISPSPTYLTYSHATSMPFVVEGCGCSSLKSIVTLLVQLVRSRRNNNNRIILALLPLLLLVLVLLHLFYKGSKLLLCSVIHCFTYL
jgi:D-arabinose 1-dehydrogenase-like Zn-dependent alcohol dehydrogenase